MTQYKPISRVVTAMAFAFCATIGVSPALAGPPSVVHADADYEGSGYVTPAGMVPPSMYQGEVMPVGFFSSPANRCDAPGVCDSMGSCGSPTCGIGSCLGEPYSDCDSCDGGCRSSGIFSGGCLLADCGCCKRLCMFCRGDGCSACQLAGSMCNPAALCAALHCLGPYKAAGIHAQRWYDFSAEAVVLTHSNGGLTGNLTSLLQGPIPPATAPPPNIVLRLGDADGGNDEELGLRLSAAFIFGAGGNLEATFMGGHQWQSEAFVQNANPVYFSFISEFGTNPIGGFDDTDRSLRQSVESRSDFDTVELNYRRRTVGPYGRFQGSWLVGLRYLHFENSLLYRTIGQMDNARGDLRFFQSNDRIKNHLFGPQIGGDVWWNICAGVNFGVGVKGAWVQNDYKRRSILNANSLGVAATPGSVQIDDADRRSTVMGEFEAKFVYRICHSWSIRSAYYAVAAEDIAFAGVSGETIRDFVTANPLTEPTFDFNSLVVQGYSLGFEYIW